MIVSLIGYRATGKSTVGRLLARELHCDCCETDELIAGVAGKSIAQIFADDGEQVFRDYEQRVIEQQLSSPRLVLSLGGGAILREATRSAIRCVGPVVWLRATPETIYRRMHDDPNTHSQRPNLTNQGGLAEIVELLRIRNPIYQATATLQIDVDDVAAEDVADSILRQMKSQGDSDR